MKGTWWEFYPHEGRLRRSQFQDWREWYTRHHPREEFHLLGRTYHGGPSSNLTSLQITLLCPEEERVLKDILGRDRK